MARNPKVSIRFEAQDQASPKIDKIESRFTRLGASIKRNALSITASLAAVVGAFRLIEDSAEKIGQQDAFARALASQGIAADQFLEKLTAISDGQIATADIILASNRALALGIRAQDLPGLLSTAAEASVNLGISVTQAFDDITTGVGRASPLILDNLGIVVDAERVYKDFAAAIGVSKDELTKQQRTIALTAAVTKTAGDATEDFADKQSQLTRNINRSRAAMNNLRTATGQVAGGLVQMVAGGVTAAILGVSVLAEGFIKLGRAITAVGSVLPIVGDGFESLGRRLKSADDGIDDLQQRMAKLALELSKGGLATVQYGLGITDIGEAAKDTAPALDRLSKGVKDTKTETDSAKGSLDEFAEALGDSAEASDRLTAASRSRVTQLREEKKAVDELVAAESRRFDIFNEQGQRVGSRLRPRERNTGTNQPGRFTGFTISGGTFTTVRQRGPGVA